MPRSRNEVIARVTSGRTSKVRTPAKRTAKTATASSAAPKTKVEGAKAKAKAKAATATGSPEKTTKQGARSARSSDGKRSATSLAKTAVKSRATKAATKTGAASAAKVKPAKKAAVKRAQATPKSPAAATKVTRKKGMRLDISAPTRAMFDLLCDGRWHNKEDVLEVGVKAALKDEYAKAVQEGKRVRRGSSATTQDYADSGARQIARNNLRIAQRTHVSADPKDPSRIRMSVGVAREWRRARSAQESAIEVQTAGIARQKFGEERIIAGWREFDAWALAPLQSRDIAYVRPNTDVSLSEMREVFPDWEVTQEPDGLISVAAPCGTPVKDVVTEWLAQNEIYHEGVRDAHNVRRREISDLPREFLEDLVSYYTGYAQRRIRGRHANSMQKLVGDPDDIAGEVALWVMECISGFDPIHGVPFGAWLTKQLPNKVMDLNRASFGRTAADAEMKRARAIEEYEAKHGVSPTQEELRDILGLSHAEFMRKERDLAHLRGLRSTATLDTGPDAPELPVPDVAADPEGDVLRLEQMQQVSRALLASSAEWDPNTGRPKKLRHLGFLIVYLVTWQEWTRGDLSILAGKAARVVTEEVNAVQEELAEKLSHLRADRPQQGGRLSTPIAG